jgi:hypothetical protein
MRAAFILICATLLTGCATPIGSAEWTAGGVRVFEHSDGRIEIIVAGSRHRTYQQLVTMWRREAEKVARSRGAASYDVLAFSTGRDLHGWHVVKEEGLVEQYAEEMVTWLPRSARGYIALH